MAELYFANVKNGWFEDFARLYGEIISKPFIRFMPIDHTHIIDFIQDAAVPEMHDRIITGVARRLGAPLITSDPLITTPEFWISGGGKPRAKHATLLVSKPKRRRFPMNSLVELYVAVDDYWQAVRPIRQQHLLSIGERQHHSAEEPPKRAKFIISNYQYGGEGKFYVPRLCDAEMTLTLRDIEVE